MFGGNSAKETRQGVNFSSTKTSVKPNYFLFSFLFRFPKNQNTNFKLERTANGGQTALEMVRSLWSKLLLSGSRRQIRDTSTFTNFKQMTADESYFNDLAVAKKSVTHAQSFSASALAPQPASPSTPCNPPKNPAAPQIEFYCRPNRGFGGSPDRWIAWNRWIAWIRRISLSGRRCLGRRRQRRRRRQ